MKFVMLKEVLLIGTVSSVIGGKYRLLKVIGHGGNGCVYLAVDYALAKRWAIKELAKEHEMLQDEVDIMKNLSHPMLPRIVDRIEENEKIYIVMDYLEGVNLALLLKHRKRLSVREVTAWGIQLCGVLQYLHSCTPQVIYRDLKPGNILLTRNGELKLIDFGCACFYDPKKNVPQTFVGSKGFAASEQYGGVSTPVTDIYGLGATMEALCLGKVPGGLKSVIKRCKKHNPHERYQTVEAVWRALERLQEEKKSSGRIRKIVICLLAVVGLFGAIQGVVQEAHKRFFYDAVGEGQYEKAIEILPDQENAYLWMLEEYVKQGNAKEGIERVERLRALYQEETKEHQQVDYTIGMLYFTGNIMDPQLTVDYEQALTYFQSINEQEVPSVKWYRRIAENLCQFGSESDWQQMKTELQEIQRACYLLADAGEKVLGYQAVASVYLANRYYLTDDSCNAIEKGIELLEICQQLLAEQLNRQGYKRLLSDIRLSLADACYLRGMQDLEVEFLEKSRITYQLLLDEVNDEFHFSILLNIACIEQSMKEYSEAAIWYEKAIAEYPNEPEGYCLYALMRLQDEEKVDEARVLFQKVTGLRHVEENQNYQILKKRMEVFE